MDDNKNCLIDFSKRFTILFDKVTVEFPSHFSNRLFERTFIYEVDKYWVADVLKHSRFISNTSVPEKYKYENNYYYYHKKKDLIFVLAKVNNHFVCLTLYHGRNSSWFDIEKVSSKPFFSDYGQPIFDSRDPTQKQKDKAVRAVKKMQAKLDQVNEEKWKAFFKDKE